MLEFSHNSKLNLNLYLYTSFGCKEEKEEVKTD